MIEEKDFLRIAGLLKCEVNAIKAVHRVEAPRGTFQEDGRLTILFEPYVFWKELRKVGYDTAKLYKLMSEHPDLISDKWNPALYGKYSEQWDKLSRAIAIHSIAACCATSYGSFQIMGNNYASLGFKYVLDLINFLSVSEANNLEAFARYVQVNHLDDELRNKDWEGFASGFNGSGYRKNDYDGKLKAAYQHFKNGGK